MRQFQWIPLASQDIRRKVPIAFFVSPHRTLRRLLPAIGADDFCPSARTARSQIGTGCIRLNVESLPGTIPTAILKKVRPLAARLVSGERGRLVFSSSGDPIRATGTKVAARDRSLVSTLVFSVSGGKPLRHPLPLPLPPLRYPLGGYLPSPVCLPCLYSCCPHAQRPVAIVPLPLHARKLGQRGSRPVRTNASGGSGNCRRNGRRALRSGVLERGAKPSLEPGSGGISGGKTSAGLLAWQRPGRWSAGMPWWWTRCLPRARQFQNGHVLLRPAHPRDTWQLWREPLKLMQQVQPCCRDAGRMKKSWRQRYRARAGRIVTVCRASGTIR